MDIEVVSNAFDAWAETVSRLKMAFLVEVQGEDNPAPQFSPHASELVGSLAALVTNLRRMGLRLRELERGDPAAHRALLRAMESMEVS